MKKAAIETSMGTITLELNDEKAPETVANFVKYAKDGHYDGTIFHRIIDGFMIQGGGYYVENNTLMQKEGAETIKGEFEANGVKNELKHTVGVLSMARTMVKDSASSQFFICVADVPHLDGQYAAFGKTADEESTAAAVELGAVPTGRLGGMFTDFPVDLVYIEKAEVIE
jgi:peptidyl-prolyl cis-trans isomerase B (cyclophilin B)